MRYNRNPDVNKRGAANRRTLRRRYRMPADAAGTSVPTEKMNMLQRIRYVSDYCFALAGARAQKRGTAPTPGLSFELMQAGALWASESGAVRSTPNSARSSSRLVSRSRSRRNDGS